MVAVFDTSSFMSLVKNYLPLDSSGELKNLICEKYLSGEIRVIQEVVEECKYTAKGIILNSLDFIKTRTDLHINTKSIIPSRDFMNLLNNEFRDHQAIKTKALDSAAVDNEKSTYLNQADCRLMLYCQKIAGENPMIVTEESTYGNDGKIHKKIPTNCSFLSIPCATLPELLTQHYKLSIYIK
ncbi:DUF4411 family protein [Mucilaginibacter sp. KACC 22063]|uniref:DUF4411 family protein n=1 Tax=Mucilaginibacter sp. KACC 22063 TaxID=3025666 RepID=UPI002366AD71|nr:DUF4411 family protein [Mucilaginibacter sp. KACC 22063]WDF56668.1 DUF4411 family protein [Mucilaginibacter sp. KACC 22063]